MPSLAPHASPPPGSADSCDRCGVTTSDLYASSDLGWICERCAYVLDPDVLRDQPWDWGEGW